MKNLGYNDRMQTNTQLHQETLKAVANERQSTHRVIALLKENHARRLYAEMAYPSLFAYVHECLGYSESQAYERVKACELAGRVPEVADKLESGELSLSVVAKLASHVRREGTDLEKTSELAQELSNCTIREAEKVLVQHATVAPIVQERITPKTSEISEVKFGAVAELLQLLERAKEFCAEASSAEVIRLALKELVRKKEKALGLVEPGKSRSKKASGPTAGKNRAVFRSRYIPMQDRRTVSKRSVGECEYLAPATGKRCASRFDIQWDHIDPFALGGETTASNLRHFCDTHNKLAAIQAFGLAVMERWIGKA